MVRTQIMIEKEQHKALKKIAKREKRSISAIIREFLDEQLHLHEERQMPKAANLLKEDYVNDKELTIFSALVGNRGHFYLKRGIHPSIPFPLTTAGNTSQLFRKF